MTDIAQVMCEIAGRHVRGDHSTCHPKICPHLKLVACLGCGGVSRSSVKDIVVQAHDQRMSFCCWLCLANYAAACAEMDDEP